MLTSTTIQPGDVIFNAWLDAVLANTFSDELGCRPVGTNLLTHVLDEALGAGSGVSPSRDYFTAPIATS